MSLIILYLGTRYDVYGFNTLRDITICIFYMTFHLHLWPSAFVKVTCTLITVSVCVFIWEAVNGMVTYIYITPFIGLIDPISRWFKINWRFASDELSTWLEQSQDLMLRSTFSFLLVTYSGLFLSFNHLSNYIFPCQLLIIVIYAMCMLGICLQKTLSQHQQLRN